MLQLLKSGGGGTDRDVEEVMIMMMMMLMMMLMMIMICRPGTASGTTTPSGTSGTRPCSTTRR